MKGVVPVSRSSGTEAKLCQMTTPDMLPHDHLLYAMAACHSITIINLQMVSESVA